MQDSFLRYMGVYLLVSNHVKHFKSMYGKLSFSDLHPMGCFIMPHTYTRLHWHADWREQLACVYTPTVICYCGLNRLITSQHSTMHAYWLWIYAELWSFCLCTFHNLSYKYVKHLVPICAMAYMWEHFPDYLKLTLNPLTWKIWWAPNNTGRWDLTWHLNGLMLSD